MRLRYLGFVLPLLAIPFVGCGGGGGPAGLGAVCAGTAELCITSCNLGCSLTNGCSVTQIALNQQLIFKFSQPIDAATVTSASVSLKTARGAEPLGDLVVQGNEVRFIPAVTVQNGQNVYGFADKEIYTLEIQGGPDAVAPILSVSGDRLPQTLRCQLTANLGVVDFDGKPPASALAVPSLDQPEVCDPQDPTFPKLCFQPDTLIVIEFSEVINTSTFTNGGTGGGIFYQVSLPDESDPKQCAARQFPLPGTVSVSIDQVNNRTRVLFRPSLLLPSLSCVTVQVTNQIRDLSGKGAVPATYFFRIIKRPVEDQFVQEDFSTKAKLDKEFSGAAWGGGTLTTGKLGGSGILGVFDATSSQKNAGKDGAGRDIWEWSTDNQKIPGSKTLTGQDITVTNGVFEFQQLIVKENEHIRFVGSNIPVIHAAGLIRIDGAISMPVPKPPTRNIDGRRGIFGGGAGAGGAAGGQGGDSPDYTGSDKQISGREGKPCVVPPGHPRASQAAGTGGAGSVAHPASGKNEDLVWIIDTGTKIFVPMTAAGGGGGSLWDTGNLSLLGTGGRAEHTVAKRPFWPFVPGELGPPSKGGVAFPVLPVVSSKSSRELFMLGGAGGGGAGVHPLYTTDVNDTKWSPGAGGAGGGGVINFQSGGDFVVGDSAEILVEGGDSNDQPHNNTLPPVHAAGGAGSGGGCLVQCGGIPSILGKISAKGGKGGQLFEKTLLYISSIGGNGGAGYIRVEADPAPPHTAFSKLDPPATPGNVGLLRSTDYNTVTVAQSLWYSTRSLFPPTYLYYVIRAKIEGKDVVYSDNPSKYPGSKPAVAGEPVVMLIQSANVDPGTGQPTNDPTPWLPANDIRVLNSKQYSSNTGNGFRLQFKLDKNDTPSGKGTIVLEEFQVFYRG